MTDEEVQRSRDKLLRRQGLVLNDPQVLSAMEHGERGYRFLPVSTGRGGSDYLVTPEQMELLDEYITAALRSAAGELARGNIDADPYWRGRTTTPAAGATTGRPATSRRAAGTRGATGVG